MPPPADDFWFQPIAEQHLPMLHGWLHRPHVVQWWGPPEPLEELRDFCRGDDPGPQATRAFIAWRDGRPIGFIQVYRVKDVGDGWWPDEADPGAHGIDEFLADPGLLGQGVGRALIRAFLRRLFADPAVTVVQTDPDPHNERAIRACSHAGFRAVGEVRTPDGPAWLMRVTRAEWLRQVEDAA